MKGGNTKRKSMWGWVNSTQADEVAAYYVSGHSVKETAEKFGITKVQVNDLAKKRRLTNGRKFREAGRKSDSPAQIAQIEKLKNQAIQRIIDRLGSLGFEYVGGYTDKNGRARIRCCKCGAEYERRVDSIKRGNIICAKCKHEQALILQAEREEQKRQDKAEKKAKRLAENPLGLSSYQLEREKRLDESHICKVCGNTYTLREYAESIGSSYCRNSGYCSAECRDKADREHVKASHKGRQDSHRHRAIKFGCEYDPSVTLAQLIKRDGLRCRLCGGVCNPNDHGYSDWVGPMSPSIDHIVPMSKGGGHTWDNVQIAHVICNSYKSNK